MTTSARYVVDASVAIKWFTKAGKDSENSQKLLSGHIDGTSPLASSSLLLYDVCNALRFNPNFGEDDLLKAAASLTKLQIEMVDFAEVSRIAIALAFARDITIYDSAYIAVSQALHIPLVTADYKLLGKIKNVPLVIPLNELEL